MRKGDDTIEPHIETVYSSTAVLDEIGIGLILLDQTGAVAVTNSIADELLSRRVGESTLLTMLVERASSVHITDVQEEGPHSVDQRVIRVVDTHGRGSIIGYRFAKSDRLGTVVTLRDITEIERYRSERRQLERLSQVGKACAMVAHEIGNPLAAIKATIQSIEREAAAAGLQDPIAAVYREIDRLDAILSQLLGFVRHRAPRKVKTQLEPIVAKAKHTASARIKHCKFVTSFTALRPFFADPDQIHQVLLNLFINAGDAMTRGGTLSVSANTSNGKMVIRVEDDGPGIAQELREKVFESFYTTKATGTGLGLSVCYRIVSDHGGAISVEERSTGKGSCFLVTLPLDKAA
jgi:signal transduction histidine kinase